MDHLDDNKKKEYMRRLLLARLRLLNKHSFYGLLLMNAKFGLDLKCPTAYTDGKKICLSPKYMDSLSDSELEFVLMHELLHIVLKHCNRGINFNNFLFNIACDIVVNSNILKSNNMDLNSITVKSEGGPSMHLAPTGEEGCKYTAEEIYYMICKNPENQKFKSFDIHDYWQQSEEKEWEERLVSTISALKEAGNYKNDIPLGALRQFNALVNPQINWRDVLKDFLSKEVCDYSFTPPDRRFEGDFFMPDFNEVDEVLKLNLVFVIDTSGSISEEQLSAALTEIKSAINEANYLEGYVICLDAKLYQPTPINEFDINTFDARGGGGTSFIKFFEKLDEVKSMMNNKLDLIIFITDGLDDFPKEEASQNIPVLWIINNDEVTPPWGLVARIDAENYKQ